jgi:hypothetical protein
MFFGSDGLVSGAALGVQEAEQLLEGLGVRAVADERLLAFGGHELVVLQLLKVM